MSTIINYIINKIDEFENYLLQPTPITAEELDNDRLIVIKNLVNNIKEIRRELNINTPEGDIDNKIKKIQRELNTI